jgi:hypothetical protein
MKRRGFLYLMGGMAGLATRPAAIDSFFAGEREDAGTNGIIGIYIHQHWPYNHPYAARTWTVDDYRGYAGGLSQLGYNTMLIWPVLETMPSPLTASDREHLETTGKVIDMLHHEFKMRAWIALCPNVAAANDAAAKYTFEKRHFFYCDTRVNPADATAMTQMIQWREKLLRPLAQTDGVAILDSDPGGYPGSTNAEFVNLLAEHRKMLDRLRPGIELYYWMHAGWEAYCRFYSTGVFKWGTAEEAKDVLNRLQELNPEPWGITVNTLAEFFPPPDRTHLAIASKLGLASRAVGFSYGAIEGEPTFPMTNFGRERALKAGETKAPQGVVGNAQTHCVQLPNTFAFARGATGRPLNENDYVEFAEELITGRGQLIVRAWQALAGDSPVAKRDMAEQLVALSKGDLPVGRLKGLLFGDPRRFAMDLVMQLRLKAAFDDLVVGTNSDRDVKTLLQKFVTAATVWQAQHGYQCAWSWPGLHETLRKLRSPAIDAVLDEKGKGRTPFERVQDQLRKTETFTPRLIAAMRSGGTESMK